MQLSVRNITLIALFAAITAVCAQISLPVPFSPVPFTLQIVAVCLAGGILGSKLGALSIVVYLLIGATGVPVFAQFSGGINILIGPTGGFLLSFPIAAFIIGFILERKNTLVASISSMLLSLIFIYGIGFLQFKFVTAMTWEKSFILSVAPYILPDIVKIALTSAAVLSVNRSLIRNNLKVSVIK